MIPKTKPEELVKAVRIISEWFDEQAANSVEDATHWGNVIRARALDEAADEIETLRLQVAALEASLVSALETTIHQALAGVVESDESDGDEWLSFEETVNFVKNYDRMYGTLHIKEDYDGNFWLKERMFAAVDVEWTTIYGPLSEDQIQKLKNTGKIYQ